MSKARNPQDSHAPGDYANQGPRKRATRSAQPDREERHQLTRELAPTDQKRQSEGMPPGGSASAPGPAEGNPADREERIREKAYQLWEEGGRQEGKSGEYWNRAAQDLEREDAQRASAAREGGPA